MALVIGYGNSLRGDDGAGPFVARQVGGEAIACTQLTPELAEPISRAERVIFVDAHAGVAAGRISIARLQPRGPSGMHGYDPESMLGWAQELYGRAPEAVLIGMGVQSFDLGEGLSPAARRAANAALRAIQKIACGSVVQCGCSEILASSH